MMTEMLARVARAMASAIEDGDFVHSSAETCPLDGVSVDGSLDLTAMARVALAALREPDPEMMAAGARAYPVTRKAIFAAMIDAVLTERTPVERESDGSV